MKIKRIQINNYRAFLVNGDEEAERYAIDLPDGENLLIYGENGSGKSSLFKALRDFFISATNSGQVFQKNLFYDEKENSEQPFIGVTLDDNNEYFFSAEVAKTNTHTTPTIAAANIAKGFISYRDLLKLHFRQQNNEPDLFNLFLGAEGLFTDIIIPSPSKPGNKVSFSKLWKKVHERLDNVALSDYNTNIAGLLQELEERANLLLKYFQKECSLKVDYVEGNIIEGLIRPPVINFKVKLFGAEISGHDDVLNEARLTALAISVYLAHVLSLPVTDLRILFLDDVFVGLDMSNRIPLIKILADSDLGDGTSFQDFQIFLTTYDREWFNIAKSYLDKQWQKAEFYVDNHSYKIERPLIRKSETYRERAVYHLTIGDYPACANYLRKAFEQNLRRILPENVLYPGFSNSSGDNSIITLSKRHLAAAENDDAWFYRLKNEENTDLQAFRFISLQQMIDQFKSLIKQYEVPFPLIDELVSIKTRLLNPLSHDDLKSPIFKSELITGFDILNELEKIVSKTILSVDDTAPIQLYSINEDFNNDTYYYRFELKDNLRLLQYGTFRTFLKARFHSQFRTRGYNFPNFEILENEYPSLRKLCEAIFFKSDPLRSQYTFYENFMFDKVFTAGNKKLSELI